MGGAGRALLADARTGQAGLAQLERGVQWRARRGQGGAYWRLVIEQSRVICFQRLVKDYERHASILADLHLIAFACLMLKQAAVLAAGLDAQIQRCLISYILRP